MNTELKPFPAAKWLILFIILHLICWTAVPFLVRYNLPMDAVEGALWGHQLEWGYDKNPFLNGWLTALALHIGGPSGWMIYLFSQLSVVISLMTVWLLAKEMLPPVYALFSVLLLEGLQYFNLHSIDFNDNTLELSLWGLTIYFFYLSVSPRHAGSRLTWALTGIFAGLGMMAKYYTAALLAALALFLFIYPENRAKLKTSSPYFGLTAFILVILPHTIWLFFHDFITVHYVFDRTAALPAWTNHVYFPAQFAWQQCEVLFPALLLFIMLFIGKAPIKAEKKIQLSLFDQRFLYYASLGPFFLTLLLSLILGIKLRAGWGMPLLSLWGILLFTFFQPRLTKASIHTFIAAIFILIAVLLTGYSVSLINSSDASSANFPGKEIAEMAASCWHDTYHTPLRYVAGPRWIGGNISLYSADHPAVFIEWDKARAPWIKLDDLKKKGALFVWDITDKPLPPHIKAQFPGLSQPQIMRFSLHRNKKNLPPIEIGMAFLPPAASS